MKNIYWAVDELCVHTSVVLHPPQSVTLHWSFLVSKWLPGNEIQKSTAALPTISILAYPYPPPPGALSPNTPVFTRGACWNQSSAFKLAWECIPLVSVAYWYCASFRSLSSVHCCPISLIRLTSFAEIPYSFFKRVISGFKSSNALSSSKVWSRQVDWSKNPEVKVFMSSQMYGCYSSNPGMFWRYFLNLFWSTRKLSILVVVLALGFYSFVFYFSSNLAMS